MGEFSAMSLDSVPVWANWFLVAVAILIIGKGARQVVEAATRIAKRLRISELVVGLTLVAAGTSLPEFGVTLVAAFEGHPSISVGNIVGSNIFNLSFILGTLALIRPIPTTPALVRRDGSALILATLLLLALIATDLTLARDDGIILLSGLALYLAAVLAMGRLEWNETDERNPAATDRDFGGAGGLPAGMRTLSLTAFGFALLAGGSHLLVNSAIPIARSLGMSEWVIGVTIVAAGTSAPEFATALAGILRGRYEMSFGNLIGSDLFNLLGVLGVAGVLHPQALESEARASLTALMAMVVLGVVFARTGWRLSRWEGLILLLFGLARWTLEFAARNGS